MATTHKPVALAVAVLLLLASVPAGANSKKEKPVFGLIYGTVYGPDHRSRYGVKVKIRRADQKKAKWEVYSDHSGEFAQRVPPGPADYVVWADVKVPKGAKQPQTTVHLENDERVDISLHLTE